jgi:hypothetical protein
MVDLTRVDRQCGKGTCSGEQCHEPQHGARRDEIARKSGCDRRDDIACMVEGFIAADAPSKAAPANNTKADCRNCRREDRVAGADCDLRCGGRPKLGEQAEHHCPSRNETGAADDQAALKNRVVDQCPSRRAGCDGGNASDRHDEADTPGVPMLARPEIDGEKRPNASLHIGKQKIEPVERSESGAFVCIRHDLQSSRRSGSPR